MVANDIDRGWISEDMVEILQLKRKKISSDGDKWGCLEMQTFEFKGVVTLQWERNNNSEATKCGIVPRKEFEIYLPSNLLPPLAQSENALTIPNPLSTPPISSLDETSPAAITSFTNFTGQFDGEELEDSMETSNEHVKLWISPVSC